MQIEFVTDVKSRANDFTLMLADVGFEYSSTSDPVWYIPALKRTYNITVSTSPENKDLILEQGRSYGLDLWDIRDKSSLPE